jgi:hypothetical protein
MSDTLKKLREPAALAAVSYAGLVLLAAVINLLVPPSYNGATQSFASRAYDQATTFLSLSVALAIAAAVYLANEISPELGRSRLVTLVALCEGGVAALFGVVTALALFGADGPPGQTKFAQFFAALGGAAVVAVATWYAWLTWQKHAVKPQQAHPAPWPGGPGAGGPGYPQQQASPPPGGFGWSPQQQQQPQQPQQPPYGAVPGQQFGGERTQMLPPVPGGVNPVAPTQAQPAVPPMMQEYQAQPQPWSPGVGGGQQVPQQGQPQQQPQSEQDQRSNSGGFPIGDWRSE